MNRRSFLATATAALVLPYQALALTKGQAESLVGKLVADINKVIASGKPVSGMIPEFERIFTRYGNVRAIARSSMGPDARRMTSAQESAYVKAFSGYLARKYGKQFDKFMSGNIQVTGASQKSKYFFVDGIASRSTGGAFEVTFVVRDSKFIDMHVEGVSVLKTERTEIGSMLDRRKGNIDQLIADLRKAG